MPLWNLKRLICSWALLIIVAQAQAATHYVPDDFANIQDAITGVVSGETIIVRDGRWTGEFNRNLDFQGKDLILQSENGPAGCIIDAEGAQFTDERCFWFHGGETSAAIVEGFTITGGSVTDWITPNNDGGGILIEEGSSPTIRDCIIEGNSARYGAGIMVRQSDPMIVDCVIRDNATITDGIGGGVYMLSSRGNVSRCEIRGNSADNAGGIALSGGLPLVNECLIIENSAVLNGGGVWWSSNSAIIRFCTIAKNEATSGGGIHNQSFGLEIYKCTITGNRASGPGHGGGIMFYGSSGSLVNYSIVWGNVDEDDPDGAQIAISSGGGSAHAAVEHSVVQGGETGVFLGTNANIGWGSYNSEEDPQFCSSDPSGDEWWMLQTDSPCFTHVWGQIGAWAADCGITPVFLQDFTATPTDEGVDLTWTVNEFAGGEFRLRGRRGERSWLVEYFSEAPGSYVAKDNSAETRNAGDVSYELSYRPAGEHWTEMGSQTVSIVTPERSILWLGAHPNPFNPQVVLSFASDRPERVTVTICDVRGRRVILLADRIFEPGEHDLRWDGRSGAGVSVASGSYLVRLETEGRILTRKVALVR